MCLPYCHPGFESQEHHQRFYPFIFALCHVEKTKINMEDSGIGPFFKNALAIISVQQKSWWFFSRGLRFAWCKIWTALSRVSWRIVSNHSQPFTTTAEHKIKYTMGSICSPIHPWLLGQGWFKPCFEPGYFLLLLTNCMMETCMLLAGVRVHEHW